MNESVHPSILSIDRETCSAIGSRSAVEALQTLARSTRIALDLEAGQMRLNGTDLTHHQSDPTLVTHAAALPVPIAPEAFADFHTSLPDVDLCLEDSWSGYFLSRCLTDRPAEEPVVLLHLDDHTDMMSTLLDVSSGGLVDPGSGREFNPRHPEDWALAIESGAINIGSFVTALYYLDCPVHVLHLNHTSDPAGARTPIYRGEIQHALLPNAIFATIQRNPTHSSESLGTYHGHADARSLMGDMPRGRVFVHVDLDYFINDFNGNIGQIPVLSDAQLRQRAQQLLDDFVAGLREKNIQVERWIIATSPGFCAAKHWAWLLEKLREVIRTG